jgi:hypothetical protein
MWRITQARWFDTLPMRVLPAQAGAAAGLPLCGRAPEERAFSALKCVDKGQLQMSPVNE